MTPDYLKKNFSDKTLITHYIISDMIQFKDARYEGKVTTLLDLRKKMVKEEGNYLFHSLVRSKMQYWGITPYKLGMAWDGKPEVHGKKIARMERFLVESGTMDIPEDIYRNCIRLLKITDEELEEIEEKKEEYSLTHPETKEESYFFMENLSLLLKYADVVIGTKKFLNTLVSDFVSGFYHVGRMGPVALGDILYIYKRNLFVYEGEDPENPDFCCKKVYGMDVSGSPLSGTARVVAFCPVCKKRYKLESGGYNSLSSYASNLQYQPSHITIYDVVKSLKELEAAGLNQRNLEIIQASIKALFTTAMEEKGWKSKIEQDWITTTIKLYLTEETVYEIEIQHKAFFEEMETLKDLLNNPHKMVHKGKISCRECLC